MTTPRARQGAKSESLPGYTEEIAVIHDVGFRGFSEKAAPGLLRILRHHGVKAGLVVDLGCGSGCWARRLIAAGYGALGIDVSSGIRIARRREPRATFKRGSFLRVTLPPCDAITAIGECLNYRFDRRSDAQELSRLFSRTYAALRPGGVFVFDLLEPGQLSRGGPSWKHAAGRGWEVAVEIAEDRGRNELRREITSFLHTGRGTSGRTRSTSSGCIVAPVSLRVCDGRGSGSGSWVGTGG